MVAEELEFHEAVATAIAETGVTFCTDHMITSTIPLNENLQTQFHNNVLGVYLMIIKGAVTS